VRRVRLILRRRCPDCMIVPRNWQIVRVLSLLFSRNIAITLQRGRGSTTALCIGGIRESRKFKTLRTSIPGAEHFVIAQCKGTRAPIEGQPIASLTFSADKGYLISHYSLYSRGKIVREETVDIALIGAAKTPFPVDIHQNSREAWLGDGAKPSREVKLSNIVLEPATTDGRFTIGALGLDEGQKVFYESTATGEIQTKVWSGGKLIEDPNARPRPYLAGLPTP